MKEKQSEYEMFPVVKEYFEKQGFIVDGDCQAFDTIPDVFAIKNDTLILVELKVSMGLRVIHQAYRHLINADEVFACVPWKWRTIKSLRQSVRINTSCSFTR